MKRSAWHTCAKIKWSRKESRVVRQIASVCAVELTVTPTIFTRIDHRWIFSAQTHAARIIPNVCVDSDHKVGGVAPKMFPHSSLNGAHDALAHARRTHIRREGDNAVHVRCQHSPSSGFTCSLGNAVFFSSNIDVRLSLFGRTIFRLAAGVTGSTDIGYADICILIK